VPALTLTILETPLAIARLDPAAPPPAWAVTGELSSITRTADELSVVCAETAIPAGIKVERGWRALKVAGPLDFALTGVLAAIAQPLAAAQVSIFAVSTYDTDYVLVRESDLARAREALSEAGHAVTGV
jgi:hypothetical protein